MFATAARSDSCDLFSHNNFSQNTARPEPGGGITENQYKSILSKFFELYSLRVRQHGAILEVRNLWNTVKPRASASRSKNKWRVNLTGGLARQKDMNEDAFVIVGCHEFGHHFGGAPRKRMSISMWSSNEGQADYYATLKCFRKYFEDEDNALVIESLPQPIPQTIKVKCEMAFDNQGDNEKAICIRSSLASLRLARIVQRLKGEDSPLVDVNTPDPSITEKMIESHPTAQCRFDTLYQGALCPISFSDELSADNPNEGTCNRLDGYSVGLRPLCWYKKKD